MSRLAAVRPADATSAQKEVIDAIAGGARGRDRPLDSLLDERGGLAGPFNAWVHRPDLGIVVQSLGERLRFHGHSAGCGAGDRDPDGRGEVDGRVRVVGTHQESAAGRECPRRRSTRYTAASARRLSDPLEQAAHDFTCRAPRDRPGGPGVVRRDSRAPRRRRARGARHPRRLTTHAGVVHPQRVRGAAAFRRAIRVRGWAMNVVAGRLLEVPIRAFG